VNVPIGDDSLVWIEEVGWGEAINVETTSPDGSIAEPSDGGDHPGNQHSCWRYSLAVQTLINAFKEEAA
jgi:hypothetical protein